MARWIQVKFFILKNWLLILPVHFQQMGLGVKRIEELTEIFSDEFDFLIAHIDQWKDHFFRSAQKLS